MHIWKKIHEWLLQERQLILLLVIDSQGSSPGRQGFKMIVNDQGEMLGSIGGGIMEHKLVERAKNDLTKNNILPKLSKQIHRSNIDKDRSGMICSGEQTIAFYLITHAQLPLIKEILQGNGVLTATGTGLAYEGNKSLRNKYQVRQINLQNWLYKEDLGKSTELHIIGGGHVGEALSKFAGELGFVVLLYDDREGLNTMITTRHVRTIHLSDYGNISDAISAGAESYVVLMSFGYRTDKIILEQLLNMELKYLGMMGSKQKVKVLFEELRNGGFTQNELDRVHSPIGIPINSRTPEEIAVSILAQIVQVKNKA